MRRYVALTTTRRGEGATRLLDMSEHQQLTFDAAVRALVADGRVTEIEADRMVEHLVVACLGGRYDRRAVLPSIRKLRDAFPRLTNKQVEALPILGCPDGDVEALVIQMRAKDGTTRVVRYDLDPGQQLWYADAMRRAMVMGGESRDEAWLNLNTLVGRLLAGGTLRKDADFFVLIGAGYFPALTTEQALALPIATEEDVRRWTFREVRPKGAGLSGPQLTD